jgi:hypothetical protein
MRFYLFGIPKGKFINYHSSIIIHQLPFLLYLCRSNFRIMKYWKITFFAAVITLSACQNGDKMPKNVENPSNTEGASFVSSDLAQAFAQQFPKAEEVVWDSTETGLIANFLENQLDCRAYYDPKGAFQYATSFIEVTALPPSVQRLLKEKYAEARPAVVMSVKNAQNQTYQIELDAATDYIVLEFDANGKMLKEQKKPLSTDELKRQEEEGVEKK